MSKKPEYTDAAMIGQMFVTQLTFQYQEAGQTYNSETTKYDTHPARWEIKAVLSDKPSRYGTDKTMTFIVEQGLGQKLAELLVPVVMQEASKEAQILADQSKAMIAALGERAIKCIAENGNDTTKA